MNDFDLHNYTVVSFNMEQEEYLKYKVLKDLNLFIYDYDVGMVRASIIN